MRFLSVMLLALTLTACAGSSPLGPAYEYEEDLTVKMDGSATMVVNASIPALNALRGMALDADMTARSDHMRDRVRELYESPYTKVGRISTWIRDGRRFVGIHVDVPDIQALPKAAPFSWAKYELRTEGDQVAFRQTLSKPPPPAVPATRAVPATPAVPAPPAVPATPTRAWRGDEIVAFRVHLPARIRFQNSRYIDGGESRPASRGNIVTWEQRLQQRLEGKPIAYAADRTPDVMEVRMDRESILYRTLWLFGIAFTAALFVLAGLIWMTVRTGRDDDAASD